MLILGGAILILGGSFVTPRYLGKKYWQLGRSFRAGKIKKEDKYYLDANFAYLDSLVIKGGVIILLIGMISLGLSFILGL